MADRLTADDVARLLAPLWQAEAMVMHRLTEMLEELRAEPYGTCHQRAAELHQARVFLYARLRALDPDAFLQAMEPVTGKALLWPPVAVTEGMKATALAEFWARRPEMKAQREAWRKADAERLGLAQGRLKTKRESLVQPLRRGA